MNNKDLSQNKSQILNSFDQSASLQKPDNILKLPNLFSSSSNKNLLKNCKNYSGISPKKLSLFIEKLITEAATRFPGDIKKKINLSYEREGGVAREILGEIRKNISLAQKKKYPICQDTGIMNFFIRIPAYFPKDEFKKNTFKALKKLIKDGIVRHNATYSLDDFPNLSPEEIKSGANVNFYFTEHRQAKIKVDLLLKGGGSENMSQQFSLPSLKIKSRRDQEGILKCALEAVKKAGGKGCPPGILGIAVGGDRSTGYFHAKKQLLRKATEISNKEIKTFEEKITGECNKLNIGPGGTGGKSTILYTKICFLPRHPACFYVTIAYNCWALRRAGGSLTLQKEVRPYF